MSVLIKARELCDRTSMSIIFPPPSAKVSNVQHKNTDSYTDNDVSNGKKVKLASEPAIHVEPRLTEVSLTAGVVGEVAIQCSPPHVKSSAGLATAPIAPPCKRMSRKAQCDTA